MQIRPCSELDLAQVRHRWPLPGDVHAGHAGQADSEYLIAWDGDEPLGSVVLRWAGPLGPHARAAHGASPALMHLHVREPFRGRGIGTALIEAGAAAAHDRGSSELVLAVGLDNPAAARLYERLGYRPSGIIDRSEYDWLDDDGLVHHEVEIDQLLVRRLPT